MKLTRKAKELFEEWYMNLPNSMGLNYGSRQITLNRFYSLPESMQWGIYQDWADSMGYDMYVHDHPYHYCWYIATKKEDEFGIKATRQEARDAAIEKLNDILQ